jgi:predicted alpha-1,2-mannosidase
MKKFLFLSLMLLGIAAMAQQNPPQPVDPNVRKGTLENGLTYYIRQNKLPENRADFYIAQKVGSMQEEDNQSGLAHFLEHMAFNGTKNFPGKNMLNYLQDNGIKFGTNINAYTSLDETVAVTLGTAYDQWCLAQLARELGRTEEHDYFMNCSFNYRNLFHPETKFFHPKDDSGNFIQPFDYRFSGGMGARGYYGENNGWVYRWDVQHNIPDLIDLMGGADEFIRNLDQMFAEPLGKSKYEFFAQLPDHTGNVGQFSMANEPSLHIPYLYNYAGAPWKTQKRIRDLIRQWFRNDLMGLPGDEDGGGMSSFVVFSQMGFYPVTPGLPGYSIGSPFFDRVEIDLGNGKIFEIEALNNSPENKYIQSATLNGKALDRSWIEHEEIAAGGRLVFVMGNRPNREWGLGE